MKNIGKKYLTYLIVVSIIIILLAVLYVFNLQHTVNQILGQ
jgi:uncharacterized membrane protein